MLLSVTEMLIVEPGGIHIILDGLPIDVIVHEIPSFPSIKESMIHVTGAAPHPVRRAACAAKYPTGNPTSYL